MRSIPATNTRAQRLIMSAYRSANDSLNLFYSTPTTITCIMITYQLIYKHDIINYTSKKIITLKQIGVQLMKNASSSEMYSM